MVIDSMTARRAPTQLDRKKMRSRPNQLFRWLLVAPFVVFLLVMMLYPIVLLVRTALSEVSIVDGAFVHSFAGLSNFTQLTTDGVAGYSFFITAVFVLVTVPATLILGIYTAILVDRSTFFARIAHTVLLWPAILTPVVVSVIWFLILSPNIGGLNRVLESLGLPGQSLLATGWGSMTAVIIIDVWHWTPLVFLLIYSALKGIDGGLLEAARVDGASEWGVYLRIALPLLRPAILTAALIRITMGAKTFDEMYLVTHGGPDNATMLVSLYIRQVIFDRLELGYGAALSIAVIFAVVLSVGLVMLGRALGRSRGVLDV